jgi:hypothetical protein
MSLKKGILLKTDLSDFDKQLTINNGTVTASTQTGLTYQHGSFIPKSDWQPLDKHQRSVLHSGRHQGYNNTIRLGEIPLPLREGFVKLGLHNCINPDDVLPAVRKHQQMVQTLSAELGAFFGSFSSTGDYKFHRITRAMPNRETITCHYIDEQFIYIGLHLDRSRLYEPHTAYRSGNRISINLGKESRSLAIVNLSLIQAFNMINKKTAGSITIDADNITALFFQNYPDYPIVKIELKPYQYYIAPTDNFFHDATTMGMTALDVTLVYTGVFDKI